MNKRLLAFAFNLLFAITLSAQPSTFSFWIESNMGISDRLFINDGSVPDRIVDLRSGLEKIRLAYEFGLLVEYPLTARWSIQSGMKYISWGYRSGKVHFELVDPSFDFPDSQRSRTQNVYLEIPLRLNYRRALGKGHFLVWGGYSPSYNVNNTIKTRSYYADEARTEKRDDPDDDRYRKFNMVGELGLGWQVPLSNKMGIKVGPNFRVQSLNLVRDAPLNRKLLFYGLMLGIQFK